MRLAGKVAIVTGGAGGIGRAIAGAFVEEGAKVVIVDVNEAAGQQVERELGASGEVLFLARDVADPAAAEEVCAAAVERFGGVDVLVNNAHASRQASLLEHTQEMFDLSFNSGFYATYHLMRACHAQLKARRGSIINFASGAGIKGQVNQASYAAAKEAIRGLSRVAALEWAEDGINVNLISPIALTAGVEQWSKARPEQYQKTLESIPFGHMGDPAKDIAPVAVFLASDDSRYMTGQTLMADGGSIMLR